MKLTSSIKAVFILAFLIISVSAPAQKKDGNLFDGYGDVGNPKLIGNFHYDPSTKIYTISGGGINIWYASDQFFYAWKKVKGNFSLTTKVAFEGKGVDPHRKIGLMIRESLDGNAKYADVAIHGDGLTSLQYRPEKGDQTKEVVGPKGGNYVTLEKVGKKIRMRTATDVYPQEITGEIELDFPGACYIGIFIGSHNTDVLETAHFYDLEYKKL
jgi:hypothetical protein